jgi:hypothetical protein
MIYQVIGDCGAGKTLLMTYLAHLRAAKGIPIYSNYHLNFKYTQLTSEFFKNYDKFPIYTAVILFDELSLYYSARRSASRQNVNFNPFIVQTRKRDLELIYSAQQTRLCDIIIRENTDGVYLPELLLLKKGTKKFIKKGEDYKHKEGDTYMLKWRFYNKDAKFIPKKSGYIYPANPVFKLYNTNEILKFDVDDDNNNKNKRGR